MWSKTIKLALIIIIPIVPSLINLFINLLNDWMAGTDWSTSALILLREGRLLKCGMVILQMLVANNTTAFFFFFLHFDIHFD